MEEELVVCVASLTSSAGGSHPTARSVTTEVKTLACPSGHVPLVFMVGKEQITGKERAQGHFLSIVDLSVTVTSAAESGGSSEYCSGKDCSGNAARSTDVLQPASMGAACLTDAIVRELILTRDEICSVLEGKVPGWSKCHLTEGFLIRRSLEEVSGIPQSPEEVELKTRKGALLKAPQMRYVITRLKYLELGAESATSEFDADLWQVLDSLYLVICTSYASSYPHIHWPNFYSLLLTTHYSPPLLNLSAYCVLLTTYSSLWLPTTPPTIGRCSRRERPRRVYCYRMSQTALRQ